MRKIPTSVKWNFYWRWRSKFGYFLCWLGWHDEEEKLRCSWQEAQTYCKCCYKDNFGSLKGWQNVCV